MSRLVCEFCAEENIVRSFANIKSYRHHRQTAHPLHHVDSKVAGNKCRELDCSYAAIKVEDLIQHLREVHNRPEFLIETKSFESREEFQMWRTQVQDSTVTRFVKRCGPRSSDKGNCTNFLNCYRTERTTRSAISGEPFKCTAFIRFVESDEGEFIAHYCLQHYGHGAMEATEGLLKASTVKGKRYHIVRFVDQLARNRTRENDKILNELCRYIDRFRQAKNMDEIVEATPEKQICSTSKRPSKTKKQILTISN